MPKDPLLNARVPAGLREQARAEAKRRGVTVSALVRDSLAAAVGQDREDASPDERGRRASGRDGKPTGGPGRGGIRAPRSPSEADGWTRGDERKPRDDESE